MLIMTMHPAGFFRRANPHRLGLVSLLCIGLAACSTTPPEPPVKLNVPAAFTEDQGWIPVSPQDAAAHGAWWLVYNDPVLDGLEQQIAQANQSLQAALAAYDQAMALTAVSRAQFYPIVGVNAAASRSKSGTINASGQTSSQSVPINIYSAGLTASWVPDLWGQVRQQVAASEASAQASAATLQSTQLSLQATLAQTYLQLRVTDAQIRLAGETVSAYQKALQLTENRYRAGVVSAADVALARTQLLGAQVTYTDLGVTRAQQQHAIAVLIGVPPSQFNLVAVVTSPAVPEIPAGVPAQLLQRRPDLAAAERKVAQANAQIGVAQTAWFPSLTLSAQTGSRVSRLADLFSAPSLFWSLGPTLAATIFDGGARSAQITSAEAGYRQTVATYRQSVLTAFQQAEDNLAAQRILTDEAGLQRQNVQAAQTSLRFAENQYKAGMVPYLNVITAQATASNAQNAELALLGRRLTASVLLIQALGGGWGERTIPALGSPSVLSE
jgi:NodT family efflux transporter outer membrane factor (OMF) lipoprotein